MLVIFGSGLADLGTSLTWDTLSESGTVRSLALLPRAGLQRAVLVLALVSLGAGVAMLMTGKRRTSAAIAGACSIGILALVLYEIAGRQSHQAHLAASYGIQGAFSFGAGSAVYVMMTGLAFIGLGSIWGVLAARRRHPRLSNTG